ncbi:MAG: hypothetical protein JNM76_07695 [Betaproteobacteria bacterium]|nr:hypothetical protein [Betaproteobacteria bacterium]
MPQGPESRREADQIASISAGREVKRGESGLPRPLAIGPDRAHARSRRPRGEAMLLHFAGGFALFSHISLHGRWVVHRAGDRTLAGLQVPDAVAVP